MKRLRERFITVIGYDSTERMEFAWFREDIRAGLDDENIRWVFKKKKKGTKARRSRSAVKETGG